MYKLVFLYYFSGMIVQEHELFHIVPEEVAVITGPHLLFRGSHQKTTNHSCGKYTLFYIYGCKDYSIDCFYDVLLIKEPLTD